MIIDPTMTVMLLTSLLMAFTQADTLITPQAIIKKPLPTRDEKADTVSAVASMIHHLVAKHVITTHLISPPLLTPSALSLFPKHHNEDICPIYKDFGTYNSYIQTSNTA
jgi:hypothetical protein